MLKSNNMWEEIPKWRSWKMCNVSISHIGETQEQGYATDKPKIITKANLVFKPTTRPFDSA